MISEELNNSQEFINTEENSEQKNSTSTSNKITDLDIINFIGNKNHGIGLHFS